MPGCRDSVMFAATLPPIQAAIRVHGSGDGLRLQLDVPASDMAAALTLAAWTGLVLRVTVEPGMDQKRLDSTQEGPDGDENRRLHF